MSREEIISWLFGLQKFGIKLGLENTLALCRLAGHPERSFRSVLVAGTNGKGSVAAMVHSVLCEAGVTAGLYTSPHLVRPEERIRPGNEDIDPLLFVDLVDGIRRVIADGLASGALERHPTFFEVMTLAAFTAFARSGLERVVLEVGLGGRWDSTNVVEPDLSIVTSIDLDHTPQLGGTLEAIASEKAGIFRGDVPALIGETAPAAREELARRARTAGARLVEAGSGTRTRVLDDGLDPSGRGRLRLDVETPLGSYEGLEVPLPGEHQAGNVVLAVRASEILLAGRDSFERDLRRGLAATRWPGRLEWIPGNPRLLLDCAHNPAGSAALARALRRIGPERCVLLFGAMHDKDIVSMTRALRGCARAVVVTRPQMDRAAATDRIRSAFEAMAPALPVSANDDVPAALEAARGLAGPDGLVCVTGSIFLVGEVRGLLDPARHEARDVPSRNAP